MSPKIMMIVTAISLCFSNLAMAKDCVWPYVGVVGGGSVSDSNRLSLSTGYSIGGLAGFEFCNARVEAEVVYRASDIDSADSVRSSGDVSLISYMVNGYYEFNVDSKKWRPYVGGGAGVSTAEMSALFVNGTQVSGRSSDTRFSYQGIGGVGFFLTKNLVLDVSYRYFSTLRFQFENFSTDLTTHNIVVGSRWRF